MAGALQEEKENEGGKNEWGGKSNSQIGESNGREEAVDRLVDLLGLLCAGT